MRVEAACAQNELFLDFLERPILLPVLDDPSGCGIGSCGVPRPSLAAYVTGMGPTDGATAAGGHGPQGNPVQFPDSHSMPTSRFPVNSHALTSVEGLLGQDEIDAAIQTTSTSKARRVDFGGCGPPI